MSNTEVIGLAREAVDLPGWKWAAGLWVVDPHGVGGLIIHASAGGWLICSPAGPSWMSTIELDGCLPDLSHPATGGILLDMLKRAIYRVEYQAGSGLTFVWIDDHRIGNCGGSAAARRRARAYCSAYLGAACVMAAVALGRWPEAS